MAPTTDTQPQLASNAALSFTTPNFYELTGGGISVSYIPSGAGGQAFFTYHDGHRMQNFRGAEIRRIEVPDLGAIVSVTTVPTVDSGSTTFSILVPVVNLPNQRGASAPIRSEGITTVHRFSLVAALNSGQREYYAVTPMRGTAEVKVIPL
jgi:hypothetical protein